MLKVQIADTPYTLERGLMFVDHLPQDEGMLFIFPRPLKMSFWGLNTVIPLDIAFIDKNGIILKISAIKPYALKTIQSDEVCQLAIEANVGYFENNKISVGSQIELKRDKNDYSYGEINFIEGNIKDNQNTKSAQIIDPTNPFEQKVNKPNEKKVGDPIGEKQPEQTDPQNLPIIGPGDIGKYLEDSFDEQPGVETFESSFEDFDQEIPQEEIQQEPLPVETEEIPTEIPEEKQYPQFNTAHEAIDWATQNNEVVRIVYTSKKGRQITRDIEPHGQFHSESTHRQILVTFDETIGNIRAFIIHNISQWAFVGRQFDKKFVVKS